MKQHYEAPEMELTFIDSNDVLMSSPGGIEDFIIVPWDGDDEDDTGGRSVRSMAAVLMVGASLSLSSCSLREIIPDTLEEGRTEYIFTAALGSGDTRAVMDEEGKMSWESGDRIWVSYGSQTNGIFTLDETSGTGIGQFSGTLNVQSINYASGRLWAVYPYGAAGSCDGESVGVEVPATQDIRDNAVIDRNAVVSVANPRTEPETGGPDFMFRNVCGGIGFTTTYNCDSIRIESLGGEFLSGKVKVTVDSDGVPSYSVTEGSTKVTAVTKGRDGNRMQFITMLPCRMASGFKVKLYVGPYVFVRTVEKSLTIKRGTMTAIENIDKIGTGSSERIPIIDLSANGTANCYIVKPNGYYKFRMTKGATSQEIDDYYLVKPLWSSTDNEYDAAYNMIFNPVIDEDYDRNPLPGYCCFQTGKATGNVVLALTNMLGEVLWSWHIWIIDGDYDPEASAVHLANDAGIIMDRNLGAISAAAGSPESIGLFYQWGRKDPFLPSAFSGTPGLPCSDKPWPAPVYTSSATGTIAYTIKNPMTFITRNPDDQNTDWMRPVSGSTMDDRWSESKGLYDPCPPGWQVPQEDMWTKALGGGYIYENPPQHWSATDKGLDFSPYTLGPCWIPGAGQIEANNGTTAIGSYGELAMLWTATSGNAGVLSSDRYSKYFGAVILDGTLMGLTSTAGRYVGGNVRCAKVGASGGTGITDLSAEERANSYIVGKAGRYSFLCSVRSKTATIPGISSVEVLWESTGTATAPARGSIVDNVTLYTEGDDVRVAFDTYTTQGNALIAVKDASGEILWSWHIWRVNDVKNENYVHTGSGWGYKSVKLMDRNLGALSAVKGDIQSNGLFYQWGRKDPFLGVSAYGSTTRAASTGTFYRTTSNAQTGTYLYAKAHPTTFIRMNSANSDWMYGTQIKSWLDNGEKSDTDPCPPGYRVPDGGPDGIWAATDGEYHDMPFNDPSLWHESMNLVYPFRYSTTGSSNLWFPATGSITTDGEYAWSGISVCGWVSGAGPDSKLAQGYVYNKSGNQYHYNVAGYARAFGRTVRCMLIEDETLINPSNVTITANGKALTSDSKLLISEDGGIHPESRVSVSAYVSPDNAYVRKVRWTSSNTDVVSVSQDGLLTGHKTGTAVVTATTYNGKTASLNVEVIGAATDLSASETANCYIVSPIQSGLFRFKATKGNSNASVGAVASVEVLWESSATTSGFQKGAVISQGSCNAGYISFYAAPSRRGNALIAAKDANGKILWSWHIWRTDTPQDQVYRYNAGTLMDRNLGAENVTKGNAGALGLYYQWGRKDPFPGAGNSALDVMAYVTPQLPAPEMIEDHHSASFTAASGTVQYMIEHPTTFLGCQTGSSHQYESSYWGDGYNRMWDGGSQSGTHAKTIYDPCPPGYTVPCSEFWRKARNRNNGSISGVTYNDHGIDWGNSGDMSSDQQFTDVPNTWYPNAGTIKVVNGSLEISGIGWMTVLLESRFPMAGYRTFYQSQPFIPNTVYFYESISPGQGYSVRCQKITW